MRVIINLVVAAVMVVPLVLVGCGAWLIVQRQTGERVDAEIVGCDLEVGYKRATEYCTATWTVDGRDHTGPIHNAGNADPGDRVSATLRDDELYSRSLVLPLILIGLGLPLCWLPFAWVRRRVRALRGDRTTPAHP